MGILQRFLVPEKLEWLGYDHAAGSIRIIMLSCSDVILERDRRIVWTELLHSSSSSFGMRVMNHNWSATQQRLHPQSVAEISRHSVLSGDRIRQCETSSGSRHKNTDQCLSVAISFYRHCSVPVPCENGSADTTVAEGNSNLVAGLWGCTELTTWADFQLCLHRLLMSTSCKSSHSSFWDVSRSNGGLRRMSVVAIVG